MTVHTIALNLRNRIWFTRQARIYSEKRLLRNEGNSQLLLLFYTVYGIALSSISMKFNPDNEKIASVFGLIFSVALFGLSFYLTTRGWGGRAQQFKKNYAELGGLIDRLDLALCQNSEEKQIAELDAISTQYQALMVQGENHSTMDDRCARFLAGKSSRPLEWWDYITVFGYSIGRYMFLVALYLWPPLMMVWLWHSKITAIIQ